jgi:hypothetical protein
MATTAIGEPRQTRLKIHRDDTTPIVAAATKEKLQRVSGFNPVLRSRAKYAHTAGLEATQCYAYCFP